MRIRSLLNLLKRTDYRQSMKAIDAPNDLMGHAFVKVFQVVDRQHEDQSLVSFGLVSGSLMTQTASII